jgi:Xaa-Pro aminopeptidase
MSARQAVTPAFDTQKLDALLERAEVDVLVATSRHNVRYLSGSYSFFFERFDAMAIDRYLPAVGYLPRRLDDAFFVGAGVDGYLHEAEPIWIPTVLDDAGTTVQTAETVARQIRGLGLERGTIAIEQSFIPARSRDELAHALPHARFVEAALLLDELRAVKSAAELALLREAAEGIVASMVATVRSGVPGATTRELADRLRAEEEARGLDFEYCLAATGPSFNRAPSGATWEPGSVLSLDSGGQKEGYLGDLCRMAVLGEPTELMVELLDEIESIQQAARAPMRPGALGLEIYESALAERARCPHGELTSFVAHGMGLVTHEAPRLRPSGSPLYPVDYRERPLEPGMVLSIETDLKMPGVGFVKLEDTVVVTEGGHEAYGDHARDWIAVPC